MSKFFRAATIAGLAMLAAACSQSSSQSTIKNASDLKTNAQKFGYAIGYDLGHSMKSMTDSIDIKSLEAGLEQGAAGQKALMDAQARRQIKVKMSKELHAKAEKKQEADAASNAKSSAKFLAETAKKPGVKTTKDGLEYKVERAGKGTPPTPDDKVTVNYKGMLPDGTVFDSSYKRHEPLTFPLKNVIPGWVEGLQLMKPGAKYTFYIPAKLAYGARGAGDKIGPNQALVFEVELLKVEHAAGSDSKAKSDGKTEASTDSKKK